MPALTLTAPISTQALKNLLSGDQVLISGTIYTARDQAHQRLNELIKQKQPLPFDLNGSVLYYTGPSPTTPGKPIGSCGPTTSGRMDVFTPLLLEKGVKVLIGKGPRSMEVKKALQENQAIYCAAIGGVGALLAQCVEKSKIIAFPKLGPEAIYRLKVKNFPVIVINDLAGRDWYCRDNS